MYSCLGGYEKVKNWTKENTLVKKCGVTPPPLLLLLLFSVLFYLKGIVSKISNDPLCKDDNARFTTALP